MPMGTMTPTAMMPLPMRLTIGISNSLRRLAVRVNSSLEKTLHSFNGPADAALFGDHAAKGSRLMRWMSLKSRARSLLGASFLVLVGNTACYHLTYSTTKPRSGVTQTGTNHFFLWGLAGHSEVHLAEKCPNGVSKLTAWQSFGDGFLKVITLGIYTPRSYEVWCAAAPSDPAPKSSGEQVP